MPYCVGLTGGLGCGKSQAAHMFVELGAGVVDTDVISRELTSAAGAAMPVIEHEFGPEYVKADNSLDRDRMRALVFSEPASRRKLEAILHPLIRVIARERMTAAHEPYLLLVAPLLLETGAYRELVNRVLIVDCKEEQQLARTMARDGLAAAEVRRIMSAQLPRAERLKHADDVLLNDDDIDSLRAKVAVLHRQYLSAAHDAA